MTWYYGNYCEPIYVPHGDPGFHRDGVFYPDPAPVSFRTPPFYDDVVSYRRSFRGQYPHFSHGGELIPAREQVHIRREDPHPFPYAYPRSAPIARWRDNDRDFPRYEVYPGVLVVEHPHGDGHDDDDDHLEFHAPQLCSDSRVRKVVDALKSFPGVVNVMADQWQMKVVVVGNDLCEHQVLRRLQRVPHMDRSVFWRDRRC